MTQTDLILSCFLHLQTSSLLVPLVYSTRETAHQMANTPTSCPTGSCRRARQSDKVQSNVMEELPGVFVLVLGEGLHISVRSV